ncbi:hypothetical protein ACS0TY_025802 [Phlomoides rotata]
MLPNESIDQFNTRFTVIINEIYDIGKEYTKKDVALRILRALPKKRWRTKVTIIKDNKYLTKMTTQQLFSTLKAHEFDLDFGETSTHSPTKTVAFKIIKSDSNKRSECKKDT